MINDTKEKLLKACLEIIQKHGLDKCSIKLICIKVMIKPSSFYHYFSGGKIEIIIEVLQSYRQGFLTELTKIEKQSKTFDEAITNYLKLHDMMLKNDNKICLCTSMMLNFSSLNPSIKEEIYNFCYDNERWLYQLFIINLQIEIEDIKQKCRYLIPALGGIMLYYRALNQVNLFYEDSKNLFTRTINSDLKPL